MSGDAFRDRITEVIHESDLYVRDSDDGILGAGLTSEAILAIPEMEAIRSCIYDLASLHYNDGYPAIKPEQVDRLRAGLAAGGGLPESVIDWVLGGPSWLTWTAPH